jgi:ABC-2 type transport system permease protein
MSDQPKMQLPTPGVPVIPLINWGGLYGLYIKEVRRFFKVQLQTIWAPAITTLLFLVIFTVALGGSGKTIMGFHYATFLAPGLIVMGMMQYSFANASFSLLAGKMQGTIIDYLMPPLATAELLFAFVGAAVTRAILVGIAVWGVMSLWSDVQVIPEHFWAVIWFGLMGAVLLALLGVLTSIWADKFDHAAAVTNFVIQPLALLSGTFYSVDKLAPAFQAISHANPFFYVISGFRYGFLGTSDSPILIGALGLLGFNTVLGIICYLVLASGWKIKA